MLVVFDLMFLICPLPFSVYVFLRIGGGGVSDPESEELISRPTRRAEEGGDSTAGG